jgi:hypothetical protein
LGFLKKGWTLKKTIGWSLIISVLGISAGFIGFYFVDESKPKSLVNDIFIEGDFDKISSSFVFDREKSNITEYDEEVSIKLYRILQKAELKRLWKRSETTPDYTLVVNGRVGSMKLHFTNEGIVLIDNDLDKEYKFTDDKEFNELLKIVQKTP